MSESAFFVVRMADDHARFWSAEDRDWTNAAGATLFAAGAPPEPFPEGGEWLSRGDPDVEESFRQDAAELARFAEEEKRGAGA